MKVMKALVKNLWKVRRYLSKSWGVNTWVYFLILLEEVQEVWIILIQRDNKKSRILDCKNAFCDTKYKTAFVFRPKGSLKWLFYLWTFDPEKNLWPCLFLDLEDKSTTRTSTGIVCHFFIRFSSIDLFFFFFFLVLVLENVVKNFGREGLNGSVWTLVCSASITLLISVDLLMHRNFSSL